ncbi:MAG: RNA polymerase sigma factor SigJ [Candidatus Pristimantibacillus lignocellulolyticus]|uniref:RNA polymerase sigma factor SigJ n=1 Tax=Candidatus Pristimantibacillus lignocellulolyticus TaxID=2994561 RepID=A0A9J6ZCN9_9BACL|nr:MAG: RNA polymerase sigma factor SigJ [Candidatus Pristimantibacillus lignocellulolyticus]
MEQTELSRLYVEYKSLLFSLAYKMTGSVADAEDVIQDVFIKLNGYEVKHNRNIKAFLCKMVTNQCLDLLRSSKNKREQYVGAWLPEPIAYIEKDPLHEMMVKSDVTYALMVLFEQLNPIERAIFILRVVLKYDYEIISEIVQKKEDNCRKILSRIKKMLPELEKKMAIEQVKTVHEQVITSFIRAFQQGNTAQVIEFLQEDVVYYADGGGKVTAAVKPIYGASRVKQLLISLATKFLANQEIYSIKQVEVNGSTGVAIMNEEKVSAVMSFEIEENKIKSIFSILNPDKLSFYHTHASYKK